MIKRFLPILALFPLACSFAQAIEPTAIPTSTSTPEPTSTPTETPTATPQLTPTPDELPLADAIYFPSALQLDDFGDTADLPLGGLVQGMNVVAMEEAVVTLPNAMLIDVGIYDDPENAEAAYEQLKLEKTSDLFEASESEGEDGTKFWIATSVVDGSTTGLPTGLFTVFITHNCRYVVLHEYVEYAGELPIATNYITPADDKAEIMATTLVGLSELACN